LAVTVEEAGADAAYCRPLKRDADLWLTLQGLTDDNGQLAVRVDVTGSVITGRPADIPVTVRFKRLGYAPLEDLHARLGLLAQVLLSPGSR